MGVLMIHLHTKFHMPNYDGSFVITMKLKAIEIISRTHHHSTGSHSIKNYLHIVKYVQSYITVPHFKHQ